MSRIRRIDARRRCRVTGDDRREHIANLSQQLFGGKTGDDDVRAQGMPEDHGHVADAEQCRSKPRLATVCTNVEGGPR